MASSTYAVTGVASGIGAELARLLKAQNHRVIGFDIQETHDNVDQFIMLDLNDVSSIAVAAASIDEPLNGLCNNAGLPPRAGLEEAILHVNFLGTRAFTHAMTQRFRTGASIVNRRCQTNLTVSWLIPIFGKWQHVLPSNTSRLHLKSSA
jgi:NAD(P)-dependent dehydrogenase (short-subunit alcohol dehydrogenase family)